MYPNSQSTEPGGTRFLLPLPELPRGETVLFFLTVPIANEGPFPTDPFVDIVQRIGAFRLIRMP